eukprot:CAMPEP_0181093778 /NCGR_PEP_ID=MMETSP1071-20121207/9634_1 /TAXON_ID=35127 /ORGANISM="Thalassiosira sp., Strain NH16" /LENGTH=54 /DNA_ID=CAMNT_0023176049 /DNA_START=87 /DNA_END=251 /DNA_ORIENTATION=+
MAGSKNTPTKKKVGVAAGKRKKKSKSVKPNLNTYIYRVLKESHPTIGITKNQWE